MVFPRRIGEPWKSWKYTERLSRICKRAHHPQTHDPCPIRFVDGGTRFQPPLPAPITDPPLRTNGSYPTKLHDIARIARWLGAEHHAHLLSSSGPAEAKRETAPCQPFAHGYFEASWPHSQPKPASRCVWYTTLDAANAGTGGLVRRSGSRTNQVWFPWGVEKGFRSQGDVLGIDCPPSWKLESTLGLDRSNGVLGGQTRSLSVVVVLMPCWEHDLQGSSPF